MVVFSYCVCFKMRKLWPNLDREDGLDTVLEVPIPEEMLCSNAHSKSAWSRCTNWMRPHGGGGGDRLSAPALGRNAELQLMLGVVGAPLVPLPVRTHRPFIKNDIKDDPIVSRRLKSIFCYWILEHTCIYIERELIFRYIW